MEIERTYYEHNSQCDKETFHPQNSRGLKTCVHCAGVFDEEGKGVATTDIRFDENYEERQPPPPAPEE